ncbi:NmrA family NAD(P)-binding protein [Sphingomonas sp. CGMCC 1.13654]|uniref:NmrA family NAD(P)-binding protein n=1 Tax=Sphingomonas chungangi TaxID=2683589 RepID=A0A838L3A5_9SPHN|nr:NmrA family NAD(P)-binding protein [Sphingomonas chungangi]MBA2933145.1 NmrA family NAD(P)-binding protein [Sphingomonas chungangi]MVW57817.1 NAD(P)H-binding protein [Sphingomonas chungangi]
MDETILVVGASGKFAGLVVPELAARGANIRGMVHKAADISAVREAGAQEVVVGDLGDPDSVAAALKGVGRVFYVAPVALPKEAEVGRAFVTAAIDAGVRRFVFSSVIHPVLSGLPNHAFKAPVEDAVLNSHLEYVFLHPTVLFQNFAGAWDGIVQSGVIAEPWSNETRFSRVDYRDVAEVAAIALTEDRLLYGTFELCADGWFDRNDIAALIGDVLDHEITPRRIDPDMLPADAQAMRPMFDHYDTIGLRGNAVTLTAILGREPRTLRAYFEQLADRSRQSKDAEQRERIPA